MTKPTVLVCLDAETTGLGADEDFVQIAAVLHREGDDKYCTTSSLALPEVSVSKGATDTHGYSWERLASLGARPSAEVAAELAREVLEFVDDAPFVLAGHNIDYDLRVLARHAPLKRLFDLAAGQICTRQLAHRVSPMLPNHQLLTVFADWCGNGHNILPHDALSDAWCVFKMVQARTNKNCLGLARWLASPCPLTAMPFGKHKGAAFQDLPEGYLVWLIGNQNMDGDVRHSAITELDTRRRLSYETLADDDIPY